MSKSTQVLALQFACDNGKKYNVRIKDADQDAGAQAVQSLGDTIVKSKAFDFDGNQTPYKFNQAVYTTTDKQTIVPAADANK